MEGTLFDIKHFAIHDGPGIRQTIFLKGCLLNCWWCHNPEGQEQSIQKYIKTSKLDGKVFKKEVDFGYKITVENLFEIIKGDKVFFEESKGGVTFSGGEPLLQFDFLYQSIIKCKENGIHTTLDTSGFASLDKIKKIASVVDLFLFDIKLIDNALHKKYTNVQVLDILDNLKWLDKNKKNVILRFPIIPNITDTKENIKEIKDFVSSLNNIKRIDLLPYHNIANSKYKTFKKENKMKGITSLNEEDVKYLKSEFESIGMIVNIGG